MKMEMKLKAGAKQRRAFTLMEVMIAAGIFFMSMFVILALVSQSLANARRLQRPIVDAAMIASELSFTNQIVEANQSGDFGDAYPGYTLDAADITEVQTNKLFRVDYVVQRSDNKEIMQKMSVLFFRPQSPAGSLDGATVAETIEVSSRKSKVESRAPAHGARNLFCFRPSTFDLRPTGRRAFTLIEIMVARCDFCNSGRGGLFDVGADFEIVAGRAGGGGASPAPAYHHPHHRRFTDVHPVVSSLDAILRFQRHQRRPAVIEFRRAPAGRFSAQRQV